MRLPYLSFMLTLALGAVLSAFVNNTPIVVLLLPILVSVCLRAKTSPSKILMPMGFATLIGGMGTTIGTSTNLLVVSVASDLGLERFGLFDFFYPAAIGGVVGLVYLWLVAPLLLPSRDIQLSDASPRLFDGRLQLPPESPAVGKTLSEAADLCEGKLDVMRIRRGARRPILPFPDVILRAGDRLRVRDTPQNLKLFEDTLRATLHNAHPNNEAQNPLAAEHPKLGRNRCGGRLAPGSHQPKRGSFSRSVPAGRVGPAPGRSGNSRQRRQHRAHPAAAPATFCWCRAPGSISPA